jgi:hypothetical protein
MFDSPTDHKIIIPGRLILWVKLLIFNSDTSEQSNENHGPIKMIDNTSTSIQLIIPQNARVKRRHFLVLILIFLLSISSLCIIYILFPKIDPYVS